MLTTWLPRPVAVEVLGQCSVVIHGMAICPFIWLIFHRRGDEITNILEAGKQKDGGNWLSKLIIYQRTGQEKARFAPKKPPKDLKTGSARYLQKQGWGPLAAQWWGTRLPTQTSPVQGTRVWSLISGDPTCCGATGPRHRNYWAMF